MSSHLHYSKISWAFRVFSEILTSMVYISRLVKDYSSFGAEEYETLRCEGHEPCSIGN